MIEQHPPIGNVDDLEASHAVRDSIEPEDGWALHSTWGYMGRDDTSTGRLLRLADLVRWLMNTKSLPRAEALELVCRAITPEVMPFIYLVSNKGERAELVSPDSGFGYMTPQKAEVSKQRAQQLASERVWRSERQRAAGGFVMQTTSVRITQAGGGKPAQLVAPGAIALVKRMKACWASPKLGRQSTCDSLDDPKSRIERVAILMTKAHELWGYGRLAQPQAAPEVDAHPAPLHLVQAVSGADRPIKTYADLKAFRLANPGAKWLDDMKVIMAKEKESRDAKPGAKRVAQAMADDLKVSRKFVDDKVREGKAIINDRLTEQKATTRHRA